MKHTAMLKNKRELQSLDRKELLIAYLYDLYLKRKEPLTEYELANFTYLAQDTLPFNYKFTKPVPYSYGLLNDVEGLRSAAYLKAQITGVESAPKYSYSLTIQGEVKGKEIYDSLPEKDRERIKNAINKAKTLTRPS